MDELVATEKPAPQAAELRPYTAAELKAAVLAKLTYSVGKAPEVASPRDWFLAVAFATRDIMVERWLESTNGVYADGRKRVYYLSLEFLIGRLLFDAMTNLGIAEPMAEALDGLGVNLARSAPHRARRGARQRRPRPPRRLFHGQHGDALDRRAWLRHPLRQRPLPPDHPRRLAAGDAGGLARQRQSVGVRAPRIQLRHRLRRLGRDDAGRGRTRPPRLASRPRRSKRSATTRRSSAGAAGTSTRCACGRRARPTRSSSTPSTPATMSARFPTTCGRRRSPRSSIRATPRRPARNCGSGRNISSPPRRCSISFAATSSSTATCARSASTRPSSSTTPIRRSPSPN